MKLTKNEAETIKQQLETIYKANISPDTKMVKIEDYLQEHFPGLFEYIDEIFMSSWIFDCDFRIHELSDLDSENRESEETTPGGWYDPENEAVADKIQDYKEQGYKHIKYVNDANGTDMITTLVDSDIRFIIDDLYLTKEFDTEN